MMMTYTQKIQDEFSKKTAEARLQDMAAEDIRKLGAPEPWLIHVRELYGITYSFEYGDHHNEALCTPEFCDDIAAKLKPEPLAYARGHYRYWVPAATETEFCEAIETGGRFCRDKITEFFEILPFYLVFDHFGTSVKYITKIAESFALVSLKIANGHRYAAAGLDGNVHHHGRYGPVSHIDGRHVRLPQVNIYHGDTWAAEFAGSVVYAQGSRDNWGRAVVYAHIGNYDAAKKVTPSDVLAALHPERETTDYDERVRALEAEGMTRSDAQAAIDAEVKTS